MAKLTDAQIRAWIKSGTHFEGKADGNGLFLSYRKSFTTPVWNYRYRFAGKQRKMQIGNYNQMSLAEARKAVKELAAKVSLGHDVTAEKQERKKQAIEQIEAKANAFTAGQLADKYFSDRIMGHWKHPNIIRSKIEKDIKPYIGHMPVDLVKPLHIDEILKAIVNRGAPTVSNDVLRILKHMFDYAIKRHIVQYNPAAAFDINDAGGKENSRERSLNKEEITALFEAMHLAKGFSRTNLLTIKLLLILAVRKNELCRARKSDFDLEKGEWQLTGSKTGLSVIIPLPSQAISALNELLTLSDSQEWLLPARKSQDRRLPYISESTLNVALKKVTPLMEGIDPFTIHDFRRTARTIIGSLGFPSHVGERCLNHKIKGVEGVYDRYDYYDERKQALQALGNFIEACEENQTFNIIPFDTKTA